MEQKLSIATINDKLFSDFEKICNSNNQNMNEILESFIESYVDEFKHNQENVSFEYNKVLTEVLNNILTSVYKSSKDKELESLSLDDLFGVLYDRSKIQMFDRLNQFRKCKDDLSVSIDMKQYLIDEFIYYTISKYIIDALVMSKKDVIERFNSIE